MRIQVLIGEKELEALDEWRSKRQIWSRSEAIRRLVNDGVKRDAGLKKAVEGD